MTEEENNVVLRLLRETRNDVASMSGRMMSFERHVEDMKESVGYALGLSAHANVAYETTGQRLDRLTEPVDGLEARIEQLEKPQ